MKLMSVTMLVFFLVLISFAVFPDRVVIRGKPVIMESHSGYYTFPSSFSTIADYRYINLADINRVCYLNQRPELSSLDRLQLVIEEYGKKLLWNCYKFDPRFFKIDY